MADATKEKTIFLSTSKLEADFTAAVTDIITCAAHGLQNGDLVHVSTTTTLPAGLSASTDYYVIERTENTFELSLTPGGTAVDITDTGTGTHTFSLKGKAIYVGGYKHNDITIDFSDTPVMTIKVQGSIHEGVDLNAAKSATNRWDYVEVYDLEDGAAIDGDTGLTASANDHRLLEVNINGLAWISVAVTAWTSGRLGATIRSYNN